MDCLYRSPTSRRSPSRRGFALLITITLLAFLVLLLVSLASLTRVETQVASNNQQLSQARQNALMALNIALGQLQKYAGPDQRVTTTADLVADEDKAGTAAPSPLYSTTAQVDVKSGSRHWTAAWGNTQQNIGYGIRPHQIPPTTGNRRGVTPGLLNWLISGNETAAFTANGTLGAVNVGTALTYTPADAVDLTNLDSPTVKGDPAIILVGANSVGTGATAQKDYVVAPLKNIEAPASSIPGADATSTTPVRVGRYAWWVGDEGVKARINLQNGYQQTGAATDQINSFITAQRSAVEFMDRGPVGTPIPAVVGADFDFENAGVPNILSGSQLTMVNTDSAAQTRLTQAAQNRFHDLTTRSLGVLSDPYAGGLKKDLTADIADITATGNNPAGDRPGDDDPVFTPINTAEKQLPTWGHFRSWARTHPDSATGLIDPSSAEAKAAGISPVVLFAGMGMNYYLDGAGHLKMAFYPMVVLYNPYSWTIKATDYDVAIRFGNYSGNASAQNSFSIRTKKAVDAAYTEVGKVDLNSVAIYPSDAVPTGLQNSFFRLRVSAQDKGGVNRDIPPGERFSYMLTTSAINEYNHSAPPELRRVMKVEDETTNYFTLTSPPFPSAFANTTDHIILYGNNGTSNNSGTNTTSLFFMETSVALADAGALANVAWPTDPTVFRSAVLNVFPILRGVVSNTHFCKLNTDPDPEPISNRIPLGLVSPKAKTAFRMGAINEARDNFSTMNRMGFSQDLPAMRYLANANLRAPYIAATALENHSTTTSVGIGSGLGTRHSARPFGAMLQGGNPDEEHLNPFPGRHLNFSHYGFGFRTPAMGHNQRAILFDVLESDNRLLSLGQLQHVPWARYSFHTSYPFGNSFAPLRIPRIITYRSSNARRPESMLTGGAMATANDPIYDLPWHLNRAIWDRYFVSGIPSALASLSDPLPNTRMAVYTGAGTPALDELRYSGSGTNQAYDQAAAHLMVQGAFNINSTSEQAWRAILSGSKGLESNPAYAAAADGVETAIPYPRFSRNITSLTVANGPYEGHATTMTMPASTEAEIRNRMHTMNRGLYLNNPLITGNTSAEVVVAELARSIVNEIRTRGPFLSLSDFINRPLTSTEHGIKGPLQAGLDNMDPSVAQVNPDSFATTIAGTTPVPASTSPIVTAYQWDREHFSGRAESGRGEVTATRWAMSPIQLTQADLLSSLGPLVSARSDTFTIRTYGETLNPTTGDTNGRAWCEAVVQRVPDYVGGEAAETKPADLTTPASQTFGRKFKVVSFRWLSPSDI